MQLHCPRCANVVAGADVDLPNGRALCRPCGELFALPNVAVAAPATLAVGLPTAGPLALDTTHRPVDLAYSEHTEGEAVVLRVTPKRAAAVPLVAFALFWDSFLFVWYGAVLHSKDPPMMAVLFPILHVGAGVFITLQALVQTFNASTMTLDRELFRLTNGPIPQPGVREPTRNIERFEAFETSEQRRAAWRIRMLTRDGRAVAMRVLVGQPEHAAFVAARLNATLVSLREPATYRG